MGASPNPYRISNLVVHRLLRNEIEVVAVGNKEGDIGTESIIKGTPTIEDVHTVTLYLSAKNQEQYYDYILNLNPKRIIFNPGAENPELEKLANEKNIETLEACSLVMLSAGNY